MLNLLKKILGTKSDRDLKELRPELDKILAVEPGIQKLSNNELREKTAEFKQRIAEVQAEETAAIAELKKQLDEEKDIDKKDGYWNQIDKLEKTAYDKVEQPAGRHSPGSLCANSRNSQAL